MSDEENAKNSTLGTREAMMRDWCICRESINEEELFEMMFDMKILNTSPD